MPDKIRGIYKLAAIIKMKKLLLIILTIISFQNDVQSQINSGDIIDLCDSIKNCGKELYCNPSELYFIDYKTFCLVDYSEIPYGNKNMTGTYRFTSDSLFLTFHPKIIIFGFKWKGEPYVSEGKTYLKKKTEKIFPLSFRIDKCQNDALMLTNAKVRKYSFGFKTKDDANEKMADLIESKEWKKLRQ
jgi:hypothetical protein